MGEKRLFERDRVLLVISPGGILELAVIEGCTRRSGRVGRDGLARHCLSESE